MNIIVCIKQVPDTMEVRIDDETKNLVREGVPSIINPYDEYGMELALRLKDQYGGTVTAVSMGPPQAQKELQYCLDMGADEAIHLCDRKLGGSDTLATGYALSQAIAKRPFDLIICGSEAIDGCTGQVGPSIAENLGIPQFTYVSALSVDGDTIHATRDVRGFNEEYTAPLPAVVCVLKGTGVRGAAPSGKKVQTVGAEGLDESRIGIDGSPTRVVHVDLSDCRQKSYVDVDCNWSCERRIDYIINGGIEINPDIHFLRGTPAELAGLLLEDEQIREIVEQ